VIAYGAWVADRRSGRKSVAHSVPGPRARDEAAVCGRAPRLPSRSPKPAEHKIRNRARQISLLRFESEAQLCDLVSAESETRRGISFGMLGPGREHGATVRVSVREEIAARRSHRSARAPGFADARIRKNVSFANELRIIPDGVVGR